MGRVHGTRDWYSGTATGVIAGIPIPLLPVVVRPIRLASCTLLECQKHYTLADLIWLNIYLDMDDDSARLSNPSDL